MMYYELAFYCLLTSLICIGFYAATEKGNVLHFLKKPVLTWLEDIEEARKNEIALVNKDEANGLGTEVVIKMHKATRNRINDFYDKQSDFISNIYKPIFLCPRCMGSVWSLLIWFPLTITQYGLTTALYFIVPAIFITVTLNSILYNQSDL